MKSVKNSANSIMEWQTKQKRRGVLRPLMKHRLIRIQMKFNKKITRIYGIPSMCQKNSDYTADSEGI